MMTSSRKTTTLLILAGLMLTGGLRLGVRYMMRIAARNDVKAEVADVEGSSIEGSLGGDLTASSTSDSECASSSFSTDDAGGSDSLTSGSIGSIGSIGSYAPGGYLSSYVPSYPLYMHHRASNRPSVRHRTFPSSDSGYAPSDSDEGGLDELRCENQWGSVSIRHRHGKKKFNARQSIKFMKKNMDNNVLAAYDIAISDGRNAKWQPSKDGVNVEVELAEPLNTEFRNLGLVHYLSGGEVEVVQNVKFNRDSDGTVKSFSFIARSFSIYAIVNTDGQLVTPRRFYHFYGHSITNGSGMDIALPYQFRDQSNDVVNVQIAKEGDFLKEPPIPTDILDEHGEVASIFRGWYVVATNERPSMAVESKLDNTNEWFQFTWPVGVNDQRMSFTNAVHVTEDVDWDYYVVPLYENARFIQFNENSKEEVGTGAKIIRRKLVALNDETGTAMIKVNDVEAALKNSRNEYFCGWEYLDVDGQYKQLLVYSEMGKPQDQYITVNDALFEANNGTIIQLYPYYVSAHFLHFNANAKSVDFVGSLFVRSTSNFSQVDVSGNRKGYDFGGWQAGFYNEETKELRLGVMVTDANGNFTPNLTITNAFTGAVSFTTDSQSNIRMNEDVTLYGTWIANSSAPYRVIIWQQRVTDDMNASEQDRKYYYVTHFTSPDVTATTHISESLIHNFTGTRRDGQTVTMQNLTSISGVSNISGEDFTGFIYNRFSCSDETVAPDGSTVINIYYDRKLMTFTFGQTTTRRGLYGQSFDWPSPPNGSLWQNDNTFMTFMDAFIPPSGDDDMTFISTRVNNMTSGVAFYKQQFDGTYLEVKTISMQSGRFSITDKFNGFHAAKYRNGNGSEVQLGSKDSSGNYATVQTSGNTTLHIYFDRNNYELMYVYEDINGEHIVRDTGKTVPYQSPLVSYDIAHTNALLDWSECIITNRTFEGWFEDASLTVPFDFTATMPDGKKFIYAKWAPLKHRVIIDPNGGELLPNEATWFYVDPSKEETIEEYTPTRKYRLDLRNGTYYYHYDVYDPVKDKHTDQYVPIYSNATRRAYYTTNIDDATTNSGSNPENRYTYDPGAYAFMGWYQAYDDGTLAIDPFSFGEPPTGPVTLRAVWRRLGVYTIQYESIDPDGQRETEIIYDPQHHSSGNIEDGYVADAETTLAKIPTNYDNDTWIWEGWQVIDTFNNNIPLTTVRSPGDIYIVRPSHADLNNVIHFRAVYKHIGDSASRHVPKVTNLILDSNENAGLAQGETFVEEIEGRQGIYTNGSADGYDGLNQGVWFAGQQNNFSVNLSDFTPSFVHSNGYFLLGWDLSRNCQSMIPSHYANETIGVNKNSSSENILYAVWEPQIYIEFINDTGSDLNDVQLYIPGWAEGEVFRVNSVKDAYRREKFTAFSNGTAMFNLSAGETLCLVLPDGADKDFATMGTCEYAEGSKLIITRIQPDVEGHEHVPDEVRTVYTGEDYLVAGTMRVCTSPVQVVFTKQTYPTIMDVPVRYFIHHPDGTVEEITDDNATVDGVSAWGSQKPLKTISNLGSSTNDLAAALRYSSALGVVGYLSQKIREQYGHTTIGIGSKDAVVTSQNFNECEYRTITNIRGQPYGGSYLRFAEESLMWSRYSHIWNAYDASSTAVYVAFYKRIPVHVTLQKSVVGSDTDADVPFTFTATYSEHSTNIEYTVTQRYRESRTWRRSGSIWSGYAWSVNGDWSNPVAYGSVTTNLTGRVLGVDTNLFDQLRSPETVTLKSRERIPFTIFYDRADPQTGSTSSVETDREPSGSESGRTTYTQYRTTTQIVTYNAAYRYEKIVIQESENSNFTLTAITDDLLSPQSNHNGISDLNNRTYTISSMRNLQHGSNNPNYYDYQLLDSTVFVNTRKTGTLTITKTVSGDYDGYAFPFTVTLGETVVGKDTYVPPAGVNIGPYGKVFTFTLTNNGSVTLPGLPVGASYTVEEGAHEKYISTPPANASGVVSESGGNVVFLNTRKGEITVTMKNLTTYFTGEEQHGHEISTIIGTGSIIDTSAYNVVGIPNGYVLTVEHYVLPRGTEVGTYNGRTENVRFTLTNGEADVTSQFLITMTPGNLTIQGTPITIEVTGNMASVPYDGEEHMCQGYTYVVKNTITGDTISSEEILVSVDPNYQQAYRKEVGTTEMHLEGHVVVTLPDGFTLQGVNVIANGYMEITPRQVTVTANSYSKLPGMPDPTFMAVVDGLIGLDAISYTITRENGEDVGKYGIIPSGNASQGNYTVIYINGTLTIAVPSLIQRSTGEGIPVEVPFTPSLLEDIGVEPSSATPESVSSVLNQVDDNNLRRWENLRLGLDPDEPPLSDGGTDDTSMQVGTPPPTNEQIDLGYAVLYELWKHIEDEEDEESRNMWRKKAGPVTKENISELAIGLVDNEGRSKSPTGLYRIVTLLIPNTHLNITNSIPSENIIGVLEVNSAYENTVVGVPWRKLASDPFHASDVTVSNHIAGVNLEVNDGIFAMSNNDTYYFWSFDKDGTWESGISTGVSPDNTHYIERESPAAGLTSLDRTVAVWISRRNPLFEDGSIRPFFLIGQYESDEVEIQISGGTSSEPGFTLMSIPDYHDYSINDLDWGMYSANNEDFIYVVNGDESHLLKWNGSAWCVEQVKYKKIGGRLRPAGSELVPYETPIKAGTGFWFCRHSSAFTVKWRPLHVAW